MSLIPTNIQSAAIGTRVMFCPEKFAMRADMTEKRVKNVNIWKPEKKPWI